MNEQRPQIPSTQEIDQSENLEAVRRLELKMELQTALINEETHSDEEIFEWINHHGEEFHAFFEQLSEQDPYLLTEIIKAIRNGDTQPLYRAWVDHQKHVH